MKFDSSISEEMKKELMQTINQPGFIENMIKQQLGEQLTILMNVRADSTTAELEGHGGMQISIERNQRYYNGRWLTFNKKKNVYEGDSASKEYTFYYTKKTKNVLGYTYYEVKSKDTINLVTLWFCKDLPPTILPE